MLSNREVEQYRDLGYLVVPDVLDAPLLAELRRTVDGIVTDAAKVATHTDVYDLEDSHTAENPGVRRIKTPHKHFPFFAQLIRNPRITAIMAQLLGPDIRLHGSKLNMKSAGYGAAVEWHQDWAFYPHTNDDVLATGLYLDDCGLENGPLLVVIEMPIDALEFVGALILGSQGIIAGQINRRARIGVACPEIADQEAQQGQPQIVGLPGTDAEEISEIAGIDALKFQGSELGEGLAPGSDDEEIRQAFDVPELGNRQGQAEKADEGDRRHRAPYNGFHGTSGLQDRRTGC